jgi:hypothetical protein
MRAAREERLNMDRRPPIDSDASPRHSAAAPYSRPSLRLSALPAGLNAAVPALRATNIEHQAKH